MIKGGFYLKARCIDGAGIAHAPPHIREIYDWLVRNSMFVDGEQLKRGQLIATYDDIRDGLCWFVGFRKMRYSKWDCEKALKWLTEKRMILTEKTTRGLIITICNYDEDQNPKNYEIKNEIRNERSHYESHNEDHSEDHSESHNEDHDEGHDEDHNESHTGTDVEQGTSSVDGNQHDTKATARATTKTTTRTTMKTTTRATTKATREPQCTDTIDKNVFKKEIKDLYTPLFEEFWKNYPARNGKKLGKPVALALFCNLKPCEALLCVHAARHYADSQMIRDGIGIRDPQRFLVSGRGKDKVEYWRDWIEPESRDDQDKPQEQEKPSGPPPEPRWYIAGDGVTVKEYGTDRVITEEEKTARALRRKAAKEAAVPVLSLVREFTA